MGQAKSKGGEWRRLSESDCLALLTENAGHSHFGQIPSIMTPSSSNVPVGSATRDDLYLHRYRPKATPMFRQKNIPNSDRLQAQYVREQFPSLEQRPRSAMETEMPLIQFDDSDDDEQMIRCPPSQSTLKAPAIYAQVRKVPSSNSNVQLRRQVPMPASPTNRMYARRSMYPTSATGNSSGLFHMEAPALLPPPPSVLAIKNPELRASGSGSARRMRPISMFPVGREVGMLMAPNTLNGRMSYAEMLEECNTIEHCACDVEGCLEDDVVQIGSPQNNDAQVNSASTEVGAIVDDNDDLMPNHSDGILSKQTPIISHHHNDQQTQSQSQQQQQQSQSNQNSIETNQKEFRDFETESDANNNKNSHNTNSIEKQSKDAQIDFSNNDTMNNIPGDTQHSMEFDRRNTVHSEENARILRCSGLECLCDRCVSHRFKLLNWLLPNCTRINAERLLQGRPNGTFLVRKSEKFPGQYTLSFVCRRTVRHCLIMRSVYGFGLRWPYSFETLQQVIIHYVRNSLVEFNSKLDTRLRYPVFMT